MALLSGLYSYEHNHNHPPRRSDLDVAHFVLSDLDLAFDQAELDALLSKEQQQQQQQQQQQSCVDVDAEFVGVRKDAVEWLIRVCNRYGFSGVTSVLGVYYFDKFLAGVGVHKGKPWMAQLVAVACLSLAAKMEEIAVPLLADLQVEGAKYVFEAKTVQRMELLVLSGLKWKMNLLTPFSFLSHFIKRFGLSKVHWEFLNLYETLVVSVIADSTYLCYRPSVLAAATMLYVIQDFEPSESFGIQDQLISVLKISKKKLDECYNLISEVSNDLDLKCKYDIPVPSSPHGIIGMSFSCENSNESWAASSIVSSHSEHPSKRKRMQEQQMRLRLPFNWPGFS